MSLRLYRAKSTSASLHYHTHPPPRASSDGRAHLVIALHFSPRDLCGTGRPDLHALTYVLKPTPESLTGHGTTYHTSHLCARSSHKRYVCVTDFLVCLLLSENGPCDERQPGTGQPGLWLHMRKGGHFP